MRAFRASCTILAAALLFAATASAQETGYTWLVDRHTYTFDDEGRWTGIFEGDRTTRSTGQ